MLKVRKRLFSCLLNALLFFMYVFSPRVQGFYTHVLCFMVYFKSHVITAFLKEPFPRIYACMYPYLYNVFFTLYILYVLFVITSDSAVCYRPPFHYQIIKIPYSYDFLTSASAWPLIIPQHNSSKWFYEYTIREPISLFLLL